jgi:hypothetical protein
MEELRAGFAGYMDVASDKDWQEMLDEVDTNKDGLISFAEFSEYMQQVLNLNYFGSGKIVKVSDTISGRGSNAMQSL